MSVETLFLDAGGVLVFPNWTRVSDALARHGVQVDAARLAAADPRAKQRLDLGDTIQATNDSERGWLYFNLVLTEAGVPLSDRTEAALAELREYHMASNVWETVPHDVPPTLERFRASGLRLVVVSNANGTLHTMFGRLGLARRVDVMLDSYNEGVEKPDPRLFDLALARAGATTTSRTRSRRWSTHCAPCCWIPPGYTTPTIARACARSTNSPTAWRTTSSSGRVNATPCACDAPSPTQSP